VSSSVVGSLVSRFCEIASFFVLVMHRPRCSRGAPCFWLFVLPVDAYIYLLSFVTLLFRALAIRVTTVFCLGTKSRGDFRVIVSALRTFVYSFFGRSVQSLVVCSYGWLRDFLLGRVFAVFKIVLWSAKSFCLLA